MADHQFSISRHSKHPKLIDLLDKEWILDKLKKDDMQLGEEKKVQEDDEEGLTMMQESRLGGLLLLILAVSKSKNNWSETVQFLADED
jgi:hypothetical protein